jgi:uncharacterized protein YhaN
MRIKSIDIDGFGVWHGLTLDELSDNATVIYGPNEAGKTTLMQFVRAVLYGFTAERRKRYLPPVHGGKPGGRLRIGNEFGSFTICRSTDPASGGPGTAAERWSAPGHVKSPEMENYREADASRSPERADDQGAIEIIDDRGEPREASQLEALLAGVDEPTYNNVFAVGLKEIQELGSLDDTAAADYLYRLTSGLDRVSLIDVIREVESARERLLATDDKATSQVPQLLARRDKLRQQIDGLARHTRRWNELATQRSNLIDEAKQLDKQIIEIEATSHVLRAALDVQGPWNMRADLQRQLDILKDVRPLPERSVEKLDAINQRLNNGRKRLKRLSARREQLKKDLESLETNKVLLSHAGRIESLHDQSQWIIGLENQIAKLREEVTKLDAEIEAAVTGYRSAGAGSGSLDELPRETVAVLRRPAQSIKEENEKLDKAKQEADEAKRALDTAIAQYDQASRTKQVPDLNHAIQEAGTKVSLLRKRIQSEERIDQLTRRRQELEVDSSDLGTSEEAPLRITALLGLFFSLGIMLILIGIFGGMYEWVVSGWQWTMFGLLVTGGSVTAKLFLEKQTEEGVTDNFRQLEQLRLQLATAKRERDELDAELPASSGSLDARMREAEIELRDLERLIPVRTEREQAEQRNQAAKSRLAAAHESVKEARHRWKNSLKSVGLPEDFAPPKVKQVVKSNEQVLELRRRRDARKDELDQRERELLVINNRLQQILDDVRHPTTSDRPIVRIRELIQAVAKEKETLALRDDVEKRLRKLIRSRDKAVAILRKASRSRHALLTLAGVEHEKAFRQAAADSARVIDLKRQQAELTIRIQTTLAGHSSPHAPREENITRSVMPTMEFTEDQVAKVFQVEGRDIKGCWDQRQKQLADIRTRLAQLHERRGACTHEMQSLACDRQMGHATLELGTVETQLTDAIRRWKILAIIGRLLEVVRKRYETDRQPETLREASQYLVRLTDGHYTRVWMPLDRRGLLVENDKGESLSLDVLSRGTREAVFIGLRLALTGSFARRGAMLPLVLDDVLVNFDTERVRCAASVLCEFSRQGHQVIMFTCHEHITDIFEDAEADVRVLPSRDGSTRVRRRRQPAVELPPPTPSVVPEEPEPVRVQPEIDPNPLLQMAAADAPLFDPVHPLPEKPKRERKRKSKAAEDWSDLHTLSAAWRNRFRSVSDAPPRAVELHLPDSWPLAEAPQPARIVKLTLPDQWPVAEQPAPKPRVVAPPVPEMFEILAYRVPTADEQLVVVPSPPPKAIILSPPQPTPPAPKHLAARRQRFTWESPEMYVEDDQE